MIIEFLSILALGIISTLLLRQIVIGLMDIYEGLKK